MPVEEKYAGIAKGSGDVAMPENEADLKLTRAEACRAINVIAQANGGIFYIVFLIVAVRLKWALVIRAW